MQEVQLYIEGQRVDLFKDEEINITQSIQNVKDPAKIFTDFSKTFTLPANGENNKLFKHYYNYDIVNGFDARLKVAAEIKLNYVTFRKGFLKLEGVNLKDNKPNLYRVTFFGETVLLKDLLGEDKLNTLVWLDNFEVNYSNSSIKSYLQNGFDKTVEGVTYNDAIVTPLITHTTRLFYDSTSGHAHDDVLIGNLFYESGSGHNHGVLWSDLKYSIRLHLIIKAIEKRYPQIQFSTDFFNTSNLDYYNLYMWMHRKKGDVQGQTTGIPIYSKLVDFGIGGGNYAVFEDTDIIIYDSYNIYIDGILTIQPSSATTPYNIKIYRNGTLITQRNNLTGNSITSTYSMDGVYNLYVESSYSLTFTTLSWNFKTFDINNNLLENVTASAGGTLISPTFTFYPTQQLPEIKIIDFLTGLFKMFNLTSYIQDDIIVVDTLDNFYATFNEYDITQYIDVNTSSVDIALPYKQIDFVYSDYKTYLSSVFNQINGVQFGELKYKGEEDQNWVGNIYKINLPFQKMLYERLNDLNGNTQTTIQWGWMADDNQSPYIGKPLIHYVKRQTGGNAISFRDSDTAHSAVSNYHIPLNSNGITGSDQSLNFNSEIDEYSLIQNTETLFNNYYFNYINKVFDLRRRLIKLKAFLPLKILLNFNLSDRFIVNGKIYKINNIDTNLQTGESKLELLNDLTTD